MFHRIAPLFVVTLIATACTKNDPPATPPAEPPATAAVVPDPAPVDERAAYIADVRRQMADIQTRFVALQPTIKLQEDPRLDKVALVADRNLSELDNRLAQYPTANEARAAELRMQIANLLEGADLILKRGDQMVRERDEAP
jgi:hypothetical protein